MSSEARFHPETTGYLYSRYKRFGDDVMDESFFPITGGRTATAHPSSIPTCGARSDGPAGGPWSPTRESGRSNETAGHSPQLTPEGESAGVGTLMSSLGSNRLGTASGAGAVSVGSPVSAVTRSRSPAPPKRRKRRRRLEPNTITSAPQS